MKKLLSTIAASAIMLWSSHMNAQDLGKNLTFLSTLDGEQQVPMVTTTARGLGSVTLNATQDTIFVNVGFHGLKTKLVGIHIHDGKPGVNGDTIFDLTNAVKGMRVVKALTGAKVNKVNIGKLLRGELYLNIHTTNYDKGEIRGQIALEKDCGFTAKLDKAQQIGDTTKINPNAVGLGVFKLSKDSLRIQVKVVVNGLSGPIKAAHFHFGAPGKNGNVIKTLTPLVVGGNTIVGEVLTTSELKDTSLVSNLIKGNIYINLHTELKKDGEIRGQVILDNYLSFDAYADAKQQVPPLNLPAKGVVSVKLSHTLDSLWVDALTTDLTGPIIAAHLHLGAPGKTGDPIVTLTPKIVGGKAVTGLFLIDTIRAKLLSNLLSGNIYFNAHTKANETAGEVRGQVLRQARIGYTASLDNAQEVPQPTPKPTATTTGLGVVTLDRDGSEINYHVLVSDLTDKVTAAHFHLGAVKQAGPPIYTITEAFERKDTNDHASGFIKTTPLNASRFNKDSIYINVHTINNKDGEIRGQVVKAAKPGVITAVVNADLTTVSNFTTAPNPATDKVEVAFTSTTSGLGKVKVLDAMGRELFAQSINISALNTVQLNVENLESGVYMVQVDNGTTQLIKKIVKN